MKRRSRNQRRQNSNRLSFQRLEARQLLAGDFVGGHQVETQLPAGENIVVNGDFETVAERDDNFYLDSEVEGWTAWDADTGQKINIFNFDSVYDNVLDLDSTIADFDRVFQDVSTEAATEYLVTFDYRNHPSENPNATPFSNDFEVWWNGSLAGRFSGGDAWHTGVISVTSSDVESTRLLFCEIQEANASGGDGMGPLLDNIRVIKSRPLDIVNGGFETTPEGQSTFFDSDTVEGWSALRNQAGDNIMRIDVSNNSGINASEGTQYLNVDTSAEQRDIVFRDLDTNPGATYYVTFDMRIDGTDGASDDQLRVRWNQDWAATIYGTNQWASYALALTAESAETELMFLEPGEDSGDGSGPLVDNIQFYSMLQNDLKVDLNGDAEGVNGAAVFIPGAGSQAIVPDISLEYKSGTNLTSAKVTLDDVVDGESEILAVVPSSVPNDSNGEPKITILSYDPATRQLLLTGSATVQEYQNVLQTLSYYNSAEEVGTTDRTVTISISDDSLPPDDSSAEALLTLSIETDQAKIDDAILTKYIADNNLDAQLVTPGLYAVIDNPGTGQNPTINSTVRVAYEGRFIELDSQNKLVDGAVFDASSDEGVVFPLANVIEGWQLGIPVFKPGGSGKLLIASALGYGPSGSGGGSIPGDTVLVFDVNLIEIVA